MSEEAGLDVRGSSEERSSQAPRDPESERAPESTLSGTANPPTTTSTSSITSNQHHNNSASPTAVSSSSSSGGSSGAIGVSIVSRSAKGAEGRSSMQFSTRPPSAEPGFMGTWQQQSTDQSNLLFRMSQQAGAVTRLPLKCDRSTMGRDLTDEVQSLL
ncbi:uncharacterized protein LOC129855626 isoform X2 [Salvelinus fontinalis]|uniref:uncharacterized protein LOC129848885 n=1 Tax=Salvelinus fontinalis TaxID=8038 RepID=UPI0024856F0E|nr:uncharacterized protein LOC129848885 [Salvelinus fontinalis]XP_055779469.1 uncharacterized protein LOC129855626 isoform X1 [Salvelinus fontinalis]XP_055779470.1 uncharacterized protein LOC129855626 isoform X2 [Salvelinus fontinalis]